MKEAAISYLSPVNSGGRTFAHQNKFSRRTRRAIGFYKIAKEKPTEQADQTSKQQNYHSFADI